MHYQRSCVFAFLLAISPGAEAFTAASPVLQCSDAAFSSSSRSRSFGETADVLAPFSRKLACVSLYDDDMGDDGVMSALDRALALSKARKEAAEQHSARFGDNRPIEISGEPPMLSNRATRLGSTTRSSAKMMLNEPDIKSNKQEFAAVPSIVARKSPQSTDRLKLLHRVDKALGAQPCRESLLQLLLIAEPNLRESDMNDQNKLAEAWNKMNRLLSPESVNDVDGMGTLRFQRAVDFVETCVSRWNNNSGGGPLQDRDGALHRVDKALLGHPSRENLLQFLQIAEPDLSDADLSNPAHVNAAWRSMMKLIRPDGHFGVDGVGTLRLQKATEFFERSKTRVNEFYSTIPTQQPQQHTSQQVAPTVQDSPNRVNKESSPSSRNGNRASRNNNNNNNNNSSPTMDPRVPVTAQYNKNRSSARSKVADATTNNSNNNKSQRGASTVQNGQNRLNDSRRQTTPRVAPADVVSKTTLNGYRSSETSSSSSSSNDNHVSSTGTTAAAASIMADPAIPRKKDEAAKASSSTNVRWHEAPTINARVVALSCIHYRDALAGEETDDETTPDYETIGGSSMAVEQVFEEKRGGYVTLDTVADIKAEIMNHGPVVSTSCRLSREFLSSCEEAASLEPSSADKNQALLIVGWDMSAVGEVWLARSAHGEEDIRIAFGQFNIEEKVIAPKTTFDLYGLPSNWHDWKEFTFPLEDDERQKEFSDACGGLPITAACMEGVRVAIRDGEKRGGSRFARLNGMVYSESDDIWYIEATFRDVQDTSMKNIPQTPQKNAFDLYHLPPDWFSFNRYTFPLENDDRHSELIRACGGLTLADACEKGERILLRDGNKKNRSRPACLNGMLYSDTENIWYVRATFQDENTV